MKRGLMLALWALALGTFGCKTHDSNSLGKDNAGERGGGLNLEQWTGGGPSAVPASQVGWTGMDTAAAKAGSIDPPLSLTASDGSGLRAVSVSARAVVEDPLAFTELHLAFHNPEPRQREGQFSITLPVGATISRFAMRTTYGTWQEGEVVEQQAAREAYEDFLHRRQDPALLEKAAGNQFTARVFPIPPSGIKELIVSYSQERTRAGEPYKLALHGLPQLDRLDVSVMVAKGNQPPAKPLPAPKPNDLVKTTEVGKFKVVETHRTSYVPDKDFVVEVPLETKAAGLRHQNLAVVRVTPVAQVKADAIDSLLVLFDTSASRALGFPRQVGRLGGFVAALRAQVGGQLPLRVLAFDQTTEPLYNGPISGFGATQLQQILERRALGASDFAQALRAVAQLQGGAAPRVILWSDGVVTAGKSAGEELRRAVADLRAAGVRRLDVVVDGGIRDEALLKRLVTGGSFPDGIVAAAEQEPSALVAKLQSATFSGVKVAVKGASWWWPTELDGVQPGDQALIYVDLSPPQPAPASGAPAPLAPKLASPVALASAQPLSVTLEGPQGAQTEDISPAATERPLLERAWVGARIHKLTHERETVTDATRKSDIKQQIIELSTQFRVLSDFTSLLVLESEADYARFRIDRKALSDILTVGPSGIQVLNRKQVAQLVAAVPKRPAHPAPPTGPKKRPPPQAAARPDSDGQAPSAPTIAMNQPPALQGADLERRLVGRSAGESTGGASDTGPPAPPVVPSPPAAPGDSLRAALDAPLAALPTPAAQSAPAAEPAARPSPPAPAAEMRAPEAASAPASAMPSRAFSTGGSASKASRPPSMQPGNRPAAPAKVAVNRRLRMRTNEPVADPEVADELPPPPPPPPPPPSQPDEARGDGAGVPYEGPLLQVIALIQKQQAAEALRIALAWWDGKPGDVIALIALGEAYEALGRKRDAARAYGSIIDLFPSRADLRRFAGERLERLADEPAALALAIDSYQRARESRPDHPASHRLLAYALVKSRRFAEAWDVIIEGWQRDYPEGRFAGVKRILSEDVGLIGAAWTREEPAHKDDVFTRALNLGLQLPTEPSLRFVLNWETDSNDMDFHIADGEGGHASYQNKRLLTGGELYADVTTGYGPECFSIPGPRYAFPYKLDAHYFSRGPMGYGMGKLQIIQHDGKGGLKFTERPFVVMRDHAYVDLGTVVGPLR